MKNDSRRIQAFLQRKQQQHLYRSVVCSESAQQPRMRINGEKLLTFCSNDYLGLANHPEVIAAFKSAVDQYGVGSGAAHLINGHTTAHQALEEELAEFTGRERALLFSTGYMANLGVVNALLEQGDYLFADRLNHASLIDAGLLSRARMRRYAHKDVNALKRFYEKKMPDNSMILTDGVFSMDGDLAPVNQLADVARQQRAWLMVDDAHGFGVLGKTGGGLLQQENLSQQDAPLLMATLGKAVGVSGAFIAGNHELIDYLIQTARTYVYTTAMPPALAVAASASLKLVKQQGWRREKLKQLITQFKQGAQQLGLELMPSDTAIQPVMVGNAEQAIEISEKLIQRGILVVAIRPPTVPKNTARLRITFSASHSENDVAILLEALQQTCNESRMNE